MRPLDSTQPGVLIHGGRSYAVGLLWLTVQDESTKKLLQGRIKKTEADYYCQRFHISQQQGFGWLGKGHKNRMPAAAAMVADQLVGEWHGVFEGDNGWWYVQVRSDTITPHGDRFYTSEEEAFNVFRQEAEQHNWPHSYAPAKWGMNDSNTREVSLRDLLDDLVTTQLVATNFTAFCGGVKQRNTALLGLSAGVAVMAAIIAYAAFKEPSNPLPEIRRVQPVPTLQAPQIDQNVTVIDPQQFLRACGQAAAQLVAPIPGWTLKNFICEPEKATVNWDQGTGSLNNAKKVGAVIWPEKTAISYTNKIMSAVLTLDKMPQMQQEQLLNRDQAMLSLEMVLQPLGAVDVKPVIPPPPPAPTRSSFLDNSPPPPPPKAPPPYLEIKLLTNLGPKVVGPVLDMRGLDIKTITWQIPQGIWQYNMKLTHQAMTKAIVPSSRPVVLPGATVGAPMGPAPGLPAREIMPAGAAASVNAAGQKPLASSQEKRP